MKHQRSIRGIFYLLVLFIETTFPLGTQSQMCTVRFFLAFYPLETPNPNTQQGGGGATKLESQRNREEPEGQLSAEN